MKNKFTKLEKSWITYDWANSVYATVVLAAIYPVYFTSVAGAAGVPGDMWWGYGTSAATLVMAVLAPVIGAFGDFKGMKKRLFALFLAGGLVFTALGIFADDWRLLLVSYALSHVGFLGSCLLYDSFITDVTTPERMDRVSSWGYGMGYIGGSTIPFLVCVVLVMLADTLGIGDAGAVKWSLVITVVWWAAFSIPMLKNVKQVYYSESRPAHPGRQAFRNLWHTMKDIAKNRAVLLFLIAYFFYIDGVNTVINMATTYGAALGLDTTGMILALVVTQVVAFPCAILFGRLCKKVGSINMIITAICVYFVICVLGFFMGFSTEENLLTNSQALIIFWILAVLVGTCQGGIQAISRSYFGKLIPRERSTEYFGFYDIFGKFAAIMGPVLYSITRGLTGRSSLSLLSLILLFAVGGVVLVVNKALFRKAEQEAAEKQ